VVLVKELKEECGISITECDFFKQFLMIYGDKSVELFFYKVTGFDGEPVWPKKWQEVRWVVLLIWCPYDFQRRTSQIVVALWRIY